MRAVLIPVDPLEAITDLDVAGDWRSLAAAVGADYIERVSLFGGDLDLGYPVLAVDESGLLNGAAYNARASALYPGPLHGPVLVVGEKWVDGDDDSGPDFVGLEDIPQRGETWVGWVESQVQAWR